MHIDQAVDVTVGPFRVLDATQQDVVSRIVSLGTEGTGRAVLVYALHVGGLNARQDERFVDAMARADLVYADGGSVIWLARLAGARNIERSPTTDVGWEILRGLAGSLLRPVRVALIGGVEGLAERAGRVLSRGAPIDVVFTEHGYRRDWADSLAELRRRAPDVTLVGMGAPKEMVWCQENLASLPDGLVLTCGGWFGYLAGDERRAPRLLRRSGVEWVARLAQSPGRLAPRYVRGTWSSAAMSISTLRRPSNRYDEENGY